MLFFRLFAAIIYDSFVLFSFWILLTAFALILNQGNSLLLYRFYFLSYLFIATGILLSYFWCKKGQTLGMAAWRIKLVQENGSPLSCSQAIIRYLVGSLSFFLGGIGFVWCLFNKNHQPLHDVVAKTNVVMLKKA
jgi:uncharacterized RDD family membrane protein YckC